MFGVNVDERKPPPPGQPPKPPGPPLLRGFVMSQLRKRAIGAAVLVVAMAVNWRINVVWARRKRYLEFYRTYDSDADFQRMVKAGVFQSVREDGSVGSL